MYDIPKLKRELAELDAKRAPLVALISAIEAYEQTVGRVVQGPGGNVVIRQRVRPSGSGPVTTQTVDLVLELAEKLGRPIPTHEVVAAMRERNMPLPDKNPTNVVSARLSNSAAVKGRRDAGWWPVGKPWPDEAGWLDQNENMGGTDVTATA